MTRINLVDPADLSDQHLRAELRELPRVFSSKIDISDAPERYCLGKGHVKWAKAHPYFIGFRYQDLYKEAMFRGFETSYKPMDLWKNSGTVIMVVLSHSRIIMKYLLRT